MRTACLPWRQHLTQLLFSMVQYIVLCSRSRVLSEPIQSPKVHYSNSSCIHDNLEISELLPWRLNLILLGSWFSRSYHTPPLSRAILVGRWLESFLAPNVVATQPQCNSCIIAQSQAVFQLQNNNNKSKHKWYSPCYLCSSDSRHNDVLMSCGHLK